METKATGKKDTLKKVRVMRPPHFAECNDLIVILTQQRFDSLRATGCQSDDY
jgi:hypothetical protein